MAKKQESRSADVAKISADVGLKPPQALEIEEAVLAAMLLDPSCVSDVISQLPSDCFYKESHKNIYEAMKRVAGRHENVDILTVSDQMRRDGTLEAAGGLGFLSALTMKITAASHIELHAKILLQKYIQRSLISVSYEVQKKAFDDSEPVEDIIAYAQDQMYGLANSSTSDTTPISDVLQRTLDEITEAQQREDGYSGVPSGYKGLDAVTYGWQKSDMIIIAARPSVGKTAFVLTMARNMTVDYSIPVAVFSLEMSASQLMKRILISETGLSRKKIWGQEKFAEPVDWNILNDRIARLERAPLWIDDTPALSISDFAAKARRLVYKNGVKLIIIDYLQLMTGPKELKGQREQEVSHISRSLKSIAKELNVPIIALSQLNRQVETRGGNKRPQLSDLRESGAIEQDADIVMFIHRPEFSGVADEGSMPGDTWLIIAKHRNGEVCDVKMRFIAEEVRYVDAAPTYENAQYETFGSRLDMSGMGGGEFPDISGSGFDGTPGQPF